MFNCAVAALNPGANGGVWLTSKQLQDLQEQLLRQPNRTLLEANEAVQKLLFKAQVVCHSRLAAVRYQKVIHQALADIAAAARKAFAQFYTDKGQQRFAERVAFYVPRVGISVTGIKVKEMGYRWASCGKRGVLNFHWKCMMAPPRIIDYIVVHELCHFHYRNHSDAFWNEVDKVLPDWRERKEWLRKRGASLDI